MAGVEESTHSMIEAERKIAFPDPAEIQKYREYAHGKQPITLSENQKKTLKGLLRNQYCDNICKRIVATVSSRVKVDRYDVANAQVEVYLKELWTLNWFKRLASRVHYSAVRDGNHAVSLGWDNISKRVTMRRELWWNGTSGVFFAYDSDGTVKYVVKEWKTKVAGPDGKVADAKRRTVWWPNRIERFVESGTGWQWFTLPAQVDSARRIIREAEKPGPQPWTANGQPDDEPLGIPAVHFARMAQPSDTDCDHALLDFYGDSILNNILGNQDAVNDLHMSLLAAARQTAYQKYWAKGVRMQDEQGNDVEFTTEPGTVWHVEDPDAEFGTLQAGDLSSLRDVLETEITSISTSTNVPIHAIKGDWPSGEALIQADRPLVDQAEDLVEDFGPSWASVAHKATEIANAFGRASLNTTALIQTVFRPAGQNDLITLSAVAGTIAPFVSRREVLRILGYSPERIEQIMSEQEDENSFVVGNPNDVDVEEGDVDGEEDEAAA